MSGSKQKATSEHVVCRNRRAFHDYEILDRLEAGLALVGSEVKSLRDGKSSLEGAYARIHDGEVWLVGAEIAEYPQAGKFGHDPKRRRKLLLHKREVVRLTGRVTQRGLTIVPLRLYFRRGLAKVELAVARGRRQYDKRQRLKEKAAQREIRRHLRRR